MTLEQILVLSGLVCLCNVVLVLALGDWTIFRYKYCVSRFDYFTVSYFCFIAIPASIVTVWWIMRRIMV